jgi:hypothetical protein
MSITDSPLCEEGIPNLLNSGDIMSSSSDDIECNTSVALNEHQDESLKIVDDECSASTDDTWTPSIDGGDSDEDIDLDDRPGIWQEVPMRFQDFNEESVRSVISNLGWCVVDIDMFECGLLQNKMKEYMAISLDGWLVIKYDGTESENGSDASESEDEGRAMDQREYHCGLEIKTPSSKNSSRMKSGHASTYMVLSPNVSLEIQPSGNWCTNRSIVCRFYTMQL